MDDRLFQLAFEQSAIGMAMVMPNGEWRKVNPALCSILGYTSEELHSMTFQDITHPKDLDIDLSYVHETLAGDRQGYQMEKRYIHKQGHVVWAQLNVSLARNAQGQPMFFISQIQDISDRKQLERELSARGRRLTAFFDAASSAQVGFCIYDEQRRFIQINQALAEINGVAVEAHTGKTTAEVLPDLTEIVEPLLLKVQATKEPILNVEIVGQTPRYLGVDSTWLASYFPIKISPSRVQVGVIVIDISERKRMEQALQNINQELARSNRELENFAYVASHDLQEPLRKIQTFGDRLQVKYGDSLEEKGKDYLRRMQSAAARMRVLIQDLLSFSRITTAAHPREKVSLNSVVAGVLSDLEATIVERNGQLHVGSLPEVHADALQMRQLFQNLIGNALKFHKPQGSPQVQVRQVPSHRDSYISVEISDNGIGIDEKYASQIFQPFQRLHGRSTYPGTGMGLAICRKIAEHHNGAITVSSAPGKGCTMVVMLPTESSNQ
ncbi:MAG: PAS domain S-box protein [Cyanobacteria bacterium P01_A01_bin.135]